MTIEERYDNLLARAKEMKCQIGDICEIQNHICRRYRLRKRQGPPFCCPDTCKYLTAEGCSIENPYYMIWYCTTTKPFIPCPEELAYLKHEIILNGISHGMNKAECLAAMEKLQRSL